MGKVITNKRLVIITAIMLILSIVLTSLAIAFIAKPEYKEIIASQPGQGNTENMGNADTFMSYDTTSEDALPDGAVLGGSETYKRSNYYEADGTTVKAGVTAISSAAELRTWLVAADNTVGFLTNNITGYMSGTNDSHRNNLSTEAYSIEAEQILDGCGYIISFGYNHTGWGNVIRDNLAASMFVHFNRGTIKNTTFTHPAEHKLYIDATANGVNYFKTGVVASFNYGTINNCIVNMDGEYKFHVQPKGGIGADWCDGVNGLFAGESSGTVSNSTVNSRALYEVYYYNRTAKSKGWMGAFVGNSTGAEINLTLNMLGGTFTSYANGNGAAFGVGAGCKENGTMRGIIVNGDTGAIKSDRIGVYSGQNSRGGSGVFEGGYVQSNSPLTSYGVLGSGTWSGKYFYNQFDSSKMGLQFSDGKPSSIVVTPKSMSESDILWDVTYINKNNNTSYASTPLANKLIKGSFIMEQYSVMGDDGCSKGLDLQITYGTYAKVKSINQQITAYDGANHELNMDLEYIGKPGTLTTGSAESYFNMMYNNEDIAGGINSSNYIVTLANVEVLGDRENFVYINNTLRVIAANPDNVDGLLVINKKVITVASDNLSLTAADKTYDSDNSYNGNVNILNNATGVMSETFALKYTRTVYDSTIVSGNVGGATKVTVNYELADANMQNYELASTTAELAATISRMKLDVTLANLNVGKTNRGYDGTTVFKGIITEKILLGANNVTVPFNITDLVYNSKNATGANAADKVIVTVALTVDSAINYELNNTTLNVAGKINKIGTVVDEENITIGSGSKEYDNSTAYEKSSVSVPNYNVNGEVISYEIVDVQYNSKDVNTANTITITLGLDADTILNYTLPTANFYKSATITTRLLDIKGSHVALKGNKTYDGNNSYTKGFTFNQIDGVNNEIVTITNAIGVYDNINAGGENRATKVTVTYELGAAFVGNYTVSGTLDLECGIDKMTVNVTVDNFDISSPTKLFDGTTDFVGTIVQSIITGANGEELTINNIAAVYDNINASGENAATKLTITYGLDSQWQENYTVSGALDIAVTIGKLSVTIDDNAVTLNVDTKVYDGTDSYDKSDVNFAGAGLVGETPVEVAVKSARYNSKDVATATHVIVDFVLSAESSINFTTDSSQVSKSASITKATLVVTATMINLSGNKAYDNSDSYTLEITQGAVTGANGEPVILTNMVGKYNSKNVVDATIVNVSFSLSADYISNYDVNASVDKSATITKATITIGADSFALSTTSKDYDGNTTYKGTITVNKIVGVGGEVVTITAPQAAYNNTNATGVNAASAILVRFNLDTVFTSNYESNSQVSIIGSINKVKVDITNNNLSVTNTSKEYDKNDAFPIDRITFTNMPTNGGVSVGLTVSEAKYNSASTDASIITIKFNLDVVSSINYTTDSVGLETGGTITPISLAVTFDNLYQSYRNSNALNAITVNVDSTNVLANDEVNATISGITGGLQEEYKQYAIGAISSNINYTLVGDATFIVGYFYKNGSTYSVETLADFAMIGSNEVYLTADYTQTVDFDAENLTIKGVRGIFSGNYDGNGKKISNAMLFNGSLFDTIAESGSIINLALVNSSINSYIDGANVAAIAAINNGTISNVTFQGWIYAVTADESRTNIGTIAAINNGTITNSETFAIMNVTADKAVVGGIAAVNSGTITGSLAFNNITVTGNSAIAGDVVAEGDGTVEATTYLNGGTYINGVLVTDGTVGAANSYNDIYTANADIFNGTTVQDILSTYMNRYNVNLDPTIEIEINDLRNIELVNQYRFLTFTLTNNVSFHKGYTHQSFGGGMSGTINYNGFSVINVTNLF